MKMKSRGMEGEEGTDEKDHNPPHMNNQFTETNQQETISQKLCILIMS